MSNPVVCPDCKQTRHLSYGGEWLVRTGRVSGRCNSCAAALRTRPVWDRLREKIHEDENGCWLWMAGRDRLEYGLAFDGTRSRPAHRVVWQTLRGPIPDGLELDHLCRNPSCVNPAHLEPVTHAENVRRGFIHHRSDTCPRGHAFDEANTYRGRFGRKCRACRRDDMRQRYREKVACS